MKMADVHNEILDPNARLLHAINELIILISIMMYVFRCIGCKYH